MDAHDIKQTTEEIQKKPSFHEFDLLDEETSKKLKSNLFFTPNLICIFDSYLYVKLEQNKLSFLDTNIKQTTKKNPNKPVLISKYEPKTSKILTGNPR